METIPCPGCRTDLEPSATVCPICLRPRGKIEITRAYATLREMDKQRKQRPFVLAGYLAAAVAAGGLAYLFHAPVIAAAASARARIGRFVEEALYPAPPAAKPAAAVPLERTASAPALFAAPVTPPAFAPASPAPAAPAPAASAPAKAVRRRAHVDDLPLPAFDSRTQWVFFGRVFDLITLVPVRDVQLSFTTEGGASAGYQRMRMSGPAEQFGARSDADGRFAVALARLPDGYSYEVRASHPGYASPALYESDIPYAALPLAERRDIARNAQDGDMTLPPLTDIAGEESIRRDVFLAPRR